MHQAFVSDLDNSFDERYQTTVSSLSTVRIAMPIGLEQWRMQIGALEAQRYRYLSRAARKAARGGRARVGRISGGCLVGIVLCVTLLCLATSFSLRLLLAGDVERNPGPLPDELLSAVDNTELNVDDLRAVFKEMYTLASKWRTMALSLGLPAHEMDEIAFTSPNNPISCLQETLLRWLQKDYNFQRYGPPTWRMLVEAVADLAGGSNPALAHKIAKGHLAAVASPIVPSSPPGHTTTPEQGQNQQTDPQETHNLSQIFARSHFPFSPGNFLETFMNITNILDKSVSVLNLKRFLNYYCHPLYPEQRYINPMKYKGSRTTAEVLVTLFPQFINYTNRFLLEDIVNRFHCDEAMELLQEYVGQLSVCRMRKPNTFPNPITAEEIEQLPGVKKLTVASHGKLVCTAVERVEEVKLVLEKATGIVSTFIIYSSHNEGSVILYFLIPETICHIFNELGDEDLTILADSGVTRLEIDDFVVGNIERFASQKTSIEDTKRGSLEFYLKERKTEIGLDKHSHLLTMLKSVPSSELHKQCSETFLAPFAKSLKNWKKFAPYFGINEWHYELLEERYPDERDQKYQALLCWRRMEGDTATYRNLLQILLLHGDNEEVEALLRRMGPDASVQHLSKWLKQKYLDDSHYDSWHAWRDVPKLMEFDQRLGELIEDAPKMLKRLDYSDCPESVDQYPSLVIPVSPKSLINSIASRKKPVLIKGPPSLGKSYLLGKVCQYWAKGFGLRRFTLVLWMNFTCLNTSVDSLEGLLAQVIPEDILKNVCAWVQIRNGKDVLFLLDEWHHNVEQGSFFHRLVSRQCLTESTVVVTSTFTPEAMPMNYTQYEMMGLTHTQISKQIIRYHELNPTRAEELLQYLASNPDMQLLSRTPANLYAILFVSQSIPSPDCDFPHTKTQFFMRLTVLLLQQTFPEYQLLPHISSLYTAYSEGKLPPPVHTFLEKLSQLAMELRGLRDSHVDRDSLLPERPAGFTFLHLNKPPLAIYLQVKFAFPDLTNFIAALHIHYQSGTKHEVLMRMKTFPWVFYAGFCNVVDGHFVRCCGLLENHCRNDVKKLASCAYESKALVNFPIRIECFILTVADIHHIIATIQNIHEMIFEGCCLGTDASVQLSKLHRYYPQLRTGFSEHQIQLSNCIFSMEGLGYLGMTTVEHLRLYGLSIKQLQVFSSRFGKHLGPTCLDLSSNLIGDEGAIAVATWLHATPQFMKLDLSSNYVQGSGVSAIASKLGFLNELDLSGNRIQKGSRDGLKCLLQSLAINPSLSVLTLENCSLQFNEEVGLTFIKAFQKNKTLKVLDLSENCLISDHGIVYVAKALKQNSGLRTLLLNSTGLSPFGAEHLAVALEINSTLQHLNLDGNEFADEGISHISRSLEQNDTLKTLSLQSCIIGQRGIETIRNFRHYSLEELDLSNNVLTDQSLMKLGSALGGNETLQKLTLFDLFHTTERGLKQFVMLLQDVPFLLELHLNPEHCVTVQQEFKLLNAERMHHHRPLLKLQNTRSVLTDWDEGASSLSSGIGIDTSEIELTDVHDAELQRDQYPNRINVGTQTESVQMQAKEIQEIPGHKVLTKLDPQYPGIRFFGDPVQQTIDSDGGILSQPEHGVYLNIPPGAVPEGVVVDIEIRTCLSGPFVLPENYQLATPVYLITPAFRFQKKIELSLEHCLHLETKSDSNLISFVYSKCKPREGKAGPEYHFHVLKDAVLDVDQDMLTGQLSHFSQVAGAVPSGTQSPKRKYHATMTSQVLHSYQHLWQAVFSIHQKGCVYKKLLEQKLGGIFQNKKIRKIQKTVCFTKDEAQLLIPEKDIKERGYIVTPDVTFMDPTISNSPVILQEEADTLDEDDPEDYPPHVLLTFEPIHTTTQKSTIDCRPMLKVTGIGRPLERVAQQSNTAVCFQLIMREELDSVSGKPSPHGTDEFQAEKPEKDATNLPGASGTSENLDGSLEVKGAKLSLRTCRTNKSHDDGSLEVKSSLDTRPTMMELFSFEGKQGDFINILEQIGESYAEFGVFLLEDENGNIVDAIASQYLNNALQINRKILTKWMNGEGRQPCTWRTLLLCLRKARKIELARRIEEGL